MVVSGIPSTSTPTVNIHNGDYASAIDKLTTRATTTSPSSPITAEANGLNTPSSDTPDPLAREYDLGPLHPRASRQYPPALQQVHVPLRTPRSRWRRAAAAIGVFLLGQALGLLYVGLAPAGEPGIVFAALTLLTWGGPWVAWFALRHRHLGQHVIHGHPLNTLAELSAGLEEPWIEVIIPDGTPHENPSALPAHLASRHGSPLADDLLVHIDSVYVRARSAPPSFDPATPSTSQASAAVENLRRNLAAELGLSTDQVRELIDLSVSSEDISPEIGGHIERATLVIQTGQALDTDAVCDGIMRAVNTLRMQFDLTVGD